MATEVHCGKRLSCRSIAGRKICSSTKRLTPKQVAAVVIGAGFLAERKITPSQPGKKISAKYSPAGIMVAIALAEHRGNVDPYAIGYNDDGSNDAGVFQINSTHGFGCDRLDPVKAAELAYRLSGAGQFFGAWATHKSGLYIRYLDRAARAVQSNPKAIRDFDDLVDQIGNVDAPGAGAVAGAYGGADTVLDWKDWLTGGGWIEGAIKVLLTGALASAGLALVGYGLVRSTSAGEKTPKVISKAAPAAAAIAKAS